MAVGAYVWDQAKPPPMLVKALNYEKWGVADVMQLPAGLLPQLNTALNFYHAMRGYRGARKSTEWSKSNPDGWNIVSWYLSERMEQRKSGDRNQ